LEEIVKLILFLSLELNGVTQVRHQKFVLVTRDEDVLECFCYLIEPSSFYISEVAHLSADSKLLENCIGVFKDFKKDLCVVNEGLMVITILILILLDNAVVLNLTLKLDRKFNKEIIYHWVH
jgi:hypothetical protein